MTHIDPYEVMAEEHQSFQPSEEQLLQSLTHMVVMAEQENQSSKLSEEQPPPIGLIRLISNMAEEKNQFTKLPEQQPLPILSVSCGCEFCQLSWDAVMGSDVAVVATGWQALWWLMVVVGGSRTVAEGFYLSPIRFVLQPKSRRPNALLPWATSFMSTTFESSIEVTYGSPSGTDGDRKTIWPELVGLTPEEAEAKIKKEMPRATVYVVPPNHFVTMDYRTDRVRIYVDSAGKVANPPRIG
ncbi:hypothetical protein RJ639_032187 [Escallonia herrerae]|uniref:Uncharacterized protein n=1 Tax=Escallonia herrerae TaxID=1293975 RepID=A0AA88WV75_9ASTE|nr:hypothetical protein RJ639_032187 [Escallonia herrerae]